MTDNTPSARDAILNDIHNIIRTSHLSRGAVMCSTPEQIVWMTAKCIADNLDAYANGEPSNYRWYPRENVLATVIRREIENTKMSATAKAIAYRAIERAVEEKPEEIEVLA
jgi:hypothetical protein